MIRVSQKPTVKGTGLLQNLKVTYVQHIKLIGAVTQVLDHKSNNFFVLVRQLMKALIKHMILFSLSSINIENVSYGLGHFMTNTNKR